MSKTTASCPHIPSQTHGCIQTHSQNNTHRPTLSVTTTCDLTQTHCHKQPWKHSLTTNSFTLRQTWCFEYLSQTHMSWATVIKDNSHFLTQTHSIKDDSHRHSLSKKTASCSNTDPCSQATFPDTHLPPLSLAMSFRDTQTTTTILATDIPSDSIHTHTLRLIDTTILRAASFHTSFS